jgi:GNAT superfamily N-acetyltransferase
MQTLSRHLAITCDMSPLDVGLRLGETLVFDNEHFHLNVVEHRSEVHVLRIETHNPGDGYGRLVVEAIAAYARATRRMPVVLSMLDEGAESFWRYMGFVEHPDDPERFIPEGFAAQLAA